MNNREAYNRWSETYDDVENKTRDLEAIALQATIQNRLFGRVLEIGCGTGKNTKQLAKQSQDVVAVDFSDGMLKKAKQKIHAKNVRFVQADINQSWEFVTASFDLVTCSLLLEHVENLQHVFHQAASALQTGGLFYVCELHPFKQYSGGKARFETNGGMFELKCFTHHISDFYNAARANGLVCDELNEWFDENQFGLPRLISFLFRKD